MTRINNEIEALASENPLVKEKLDLDIEINSLSLLKAEHKKTNKSITRKIGIFTKKY